MGGRRGKQKWGNGAGSLRSARGAWESGRNVPQGIAQRFLQMLRIGGKKMLQDFNVISVAH